MGGDVFKVVVVDVTDDVTRVVVAVCRSGRVVFRVRISVPFDSLVGHHRPTTHGLVAMVSRCVTWFSFHSMRLTTDIPCL